MRLINLTGQRFTRLLVLAIAYRRNRRVYWECRCDCGNRSAVVGSKLRNQTVRSCGCLHREQLAQGLHFKHGFSLSPEHITWKTMNQRCNNPKVKCWPDYGGRGIKVCRRWQGPHGFEHFIADMGLKPKGTSLDRRNVNKGYSPKNCRWATPTEQANNRRWSGPRPGWRGHREQIRQSARRITLFIQRNQRKNHSAV